MSTIAELQNERFALRDDLMSMKKPKRLFMTVGFTLEAACGYAGVDLKKTHYDLGLLEKAYDKICADFYSDSLPVLNLRFPIVYQILGAKNFVLGSDGTVQHPEIEVMRADEYDEFIAAPYNTIIDKFLPRVCENLNKDPATNALNLAAAFGAYKNVNGNEGAVYGKLFGKYGYAPGMIAPPFALIEAPFDFMSDQLRGFKGITMDIRRCPDKVKAAVDAVTPLMLKLAMPSVVPPGMSAFIPLHLGPYINDKAFAELYWPTLEQVVVTLDKAGIRSVLFVEEDYTRRCEFLARLPKSAIMYMERGDAGRFTDTVGKEHIFGGFYDPTITLVRSKEECIDEAKRLFDTCMKSSHFYFNFDRQVLDIKSINVSKLQAVLEWVRDNAKY